MLRGNPDPFSPVPEIEPGRPRTDGVREATDEGDLEALRQGIESGLLSGNEAKVYQALRPASRGLGRGRDR